jgi:hypothetical protein
MSNNPHPIPPRNINLDAFGDFKSASTPTINSNTSTSDFLQIMKKLDDIMYQLGVLKAEVNEIKQSRRIFTPHNPQPIVYPITPTYPGQPIPPYPYQQQIANQQQNYNQQNYNQQYNQYQHQHH